MSLLNVENIRKSYGKTEVLKDISFSLKKGEVLAIIGSSGSGKTTLLRCLNFLETPGNGKISVNDEVLFDSNDSSAKSDSEIRKRRLHFGLVFQSFNLFPQYTVIENIMLAPKLATKEQIKQTGEYMGAKSYKEAHEIIKSNAKSLLEKKGYTLEVKVFDDYVQPNNVVESGEFDANYFQHIPYLEQFNEEKGTHLAIAGKIHYEPFGIYPGTKKDLKDIAKGDKIAVPNDTTNEARALLLLQDNGIIKLKDGAGIKATVNNIVENPYDVEIVELEAAQVPRVVDETAFVVLNGNYALEANYTVSKDALAYEKSDSEAAKTYVNVIAVKEGNEDSEKIKALVDVLKSDEIKQFIEEKYQGAVIAYDGE